MNDLAPLLDIKVLGTPRPKGSLRFVSRTYAKEQNDTSPAWRGLVAGAAYRAISDPDSGDLKPGYPYLAAAELHLHLYFVPPKRRPVAPSTRTTGDIDKHARNILDALQDAGVIKDDAQVVDLRVSKRYASVAGARIILWPCSAITNPGPGAEMSFTPAPDPAPRQESLL